MVEKLNDRSVLKPLLANEWTMEVGRDAMRKEFKFTDFVNAFGFMTRAAIWAEKWNHHPEWSNVYNRVEVVLITHEVDGLSELDVKLAEKLDTLAS
ncbi:MAG TPA: 4a-hydroxytetrahydrobiopterin dehydratase [Rhodobacteraceae bacterium]|nr:4a-hydroxytetrahydrobiopterin dehydratase [Amylibacter sp.]MDG1236585.1 4a-hydroxytetrahydrobiopterin dehydratase [Amylibacter sp.]MDG1998169.1 4a-hydroxytetrahydrobiopterin dehydratase [Amylibacter sp.]HAD27162.1 4a-hydroxytetrahydrobiopterin dehydratase [Paracoccaceae bacterium]|tara:strand:- start:1576 stop:1863 length:288 start_codon:yes stop_codon:yes gene_type:complete